MKNRKTYSELILHSSFEDRYNYLRLGGGVGAKTFGFDRYLNQNFYSSAEWKRTRRYVIARDSGCDLGIQGYDIHQGLLVHHMNPVEMSDILDHEDWLLDPEYLITTSHTTHNAIHYGDATLLKKSYSPRLSGDTKLW